MWDVCSQKKTPKALGIRGFCNFGAATYVVLSSVHLNTLAGTIRKTLANFADGMFADAVHSFKREGI